MDMGLWKVTSAADQQREGKGFRKQGEPCGQNQKGQKLAWSAEQLVSWDQNPCEEVRGEQWRWLQEGLPCEASFGAAVKINKWKASTPSWTITAALWNNLACPPRSHSNKSLEIRSREMSTYLRLLHAWLTDTLFLPTDLTFF